MLVDNKADLNVQNEDKNTALILAAWNGHIEVCTKYTLIIIFTRPCIHIHKRYTIIYLRTSIFVTIPLYNHCLFIYIYIFLLY